MEELLDYVAPQVQIYECCIEKGFCYSQNGLEDPIQNPPLEW